MATEAARVTAAVKTNAEAPLAGAPAEYLDGIPREKTIPLKFPFRIDGVEYREITARKLTGAEIFRVNKAVREGKEPEAALFSAMCRIPIRAVEALDSEDIQALSEATANFTPQLASTEEELTGKDGVST